MSDNISEEITQGDNTPKEKFGVSLKKFLYAATFSANLLVMVLRLILYGAFLAGLGLSIAGSVIFESAYVFFESFVFYVLAGVGLYALTEIINRRKT